MLKKWKNPSWILTNPKFIFDWTLDKDLSFHKIWFKSVNNFLDILHTERYTNRQRV